MHLAVSTLSCPYWDLTDIFTRFPAYGLGNIDLRFVRGESALWELPEFSRDRLPETYARFAQQHITVTGISTSLKLMDEQVVDKADAPLMVASGLHGTYLRVMGGQPCGQDVRACIEERLIPNYQTLCDIARDRGLDILYETHDPYMDSKSVAGTIAQVNRPNAGVVWDVRHPVNMFGESYTQTAKNLHGIVRFAHVKDYRGGADVVAFGQGDFAPGQFVAALRATGYDGYLVLEMPNKYNPSLPPPESTLPAFVRIMSPFL